MRLGEMIGRVFGVVFRLLFAAVAGVMVTVGLLMFGVFEIARPPDIAEELARERLDDEQRAAEALGFVLESAEPLTSADEQRSISLHEDECVALIATVWGTYRVESLVVIPEQDEDPDPYATSAIAAHPYAAGLVAHAQACSAVSAAGTVGVRASAHGERGRPFDGGELRILRAPRERIGSDDRLNRGFTLRPRDPG